MDKTKIEKLNKKLAANNLPELALVSPHDCLPQKRNARYMTPEQMERLVENIKRDGHLESVPLVTAAKAEGKYSIISGHHRIEAAKLAGLEVILVMVVTVKNKDQLIAKQLSHNAIVGQDDPHMLAELYQSINDLSEKLYSGIQDAQAKVSYVSVNFRAGSFKELTLICLPEDIEFTDEVLEDIQRLSVKPDTAVRTIDAAVWDEFVRHLIRIKRTENIKSTGAALVEMARLARLYIEERNAKTSTQQTDSAKG